MFSFSYLFVLYYFFSNIYGASQDTTFLRFFKIFSLKFVVYLGLQLILVLTYIIYSKLVIFSFYALLCSIFIRRYIVYVLARFIEFTVLMY